VQALPVPDLDKAKGVILSREFTRKKYGHTSSRGVPFSLPRHPNDQKMSRTKSGSLAKPQGRKVKFTNNNLVNPVIPSKFFSSLAHASLPDFLLFLQKLGSSLANISP
jgi:hypothetical protein